MGSAVLLVCFVAIINAAFAVDCSNLVSKNDCNDLQTMVTIDMNDDSAFARSTWNRQTGQLHPVKITANYKTQKTVTCCSTAIVDTTDSTFSVGFDSCNATTTVGPKYVIDFLAEDVVNQDSCPFSITCDYTGHTLPHTTEAPTTTAPPTTTEPPTTTPEPTTTTTPEPTTTTTTPTTTTTTATTTTTTTTPAPTTTPLPCTETLTPDECDNLKTRGWCEPTDSHYVYMHFKCGITCGFCAGTLPTKSTTYGPTTTRPPEPTECSVSLCTSQPGNYNCQNCWKTCKDVKCADAPGVAAQCPDFPCYQIKQYCAKTCGICDGLDCGQ